MIFEISSSASGGIAMVIVFGLQESEMGIANSTVSYLLFPVT